MVEYVPFTISLFQQQKGIRLKNLCECLHTHRDEIEILNHFFHFVVFDMSLESNFNC